MGKRFLSRGSHPSDFGKRWNESIFNQTFRVEFCLDFLNAWVFKAPFDSVFPEKRKNHVQYQNKFVVIHQDNNLKSLIISIKTELAGVIFEHTQIRDKTMKKENMMLKYFLWEFSFLFLSVSVHCTVVRNTSWIPAVLQIITSEAPTT